MNDLFWLSDEQMVRIAPYFPLSHGIPRVDDRRVLSGIVRPCCTDQWCKRDDPDVTLGLVVGT